MNEPKSNEPMSDADPVAPEGTAPEGPGGHYWTAPLGSLSSGLLKFVSGASNVTVHADPSIKELYRARFEGQVPTVGVQAGTFSTSTLVSRPQISASPA